jgi:hypothetical protein
MLVRKWRLRLVVAVRGRRIHSKREKRSDLTYEYGTVDPDNTINCLKRYSEWGQSKMRTFA